MRRTVRHFQLLAFHEVAVRREQLHVEDAAQVGGLAVVAACDIAFVPDGVAQEIAGVVDVQVHFLLRQRLAENPYAVGEGVDARRGGRVLRLRRRAKDEKGIQPK